MGGKWCPVPLCGTPLARACGPGRAVAPAHRRIRGRGGGSPRVWNGLRIPGAPRRSETRCFPPSTDRVRSGSSGTQFSSLASRTTRAVFGRRRLRRLQRRGSRRIVFVIDSCGAVVRGIEGARGHQDMSSTPRTRKPITRVFRRGEVPPSQADWEGTTAEERINAVWELTRLCLAWSGSDEPRLQRSVCRVQRTRR